MSCLILVGGVFTVDYFTHFIGAGPTGNSFNLNSVAKKTWEIDFNGILETSLKEEGYETIGGIGILQGKQESRVTISMSKEEYKGERTKKRIEKIVNRLAKENEIGSFKAFIETKS